MFVNPTICTNKNVFSKQDAHGLISVFKSWARDLLEEVFHSALQSQLAFLSRQVRPWKANQAIVCNLIKGFEKHPEKKLLL